MIDKLQLHVKNHGSRPQQRKALELLLPSSSIYDFLEGRIPHPSDTYTKVAQILEAEEKDRMNEEIAKRRTRLGARIDQVRRDVRQEILGNSTLEEVYSQVVNWTRDDAVRRDFEERLLQHAYQTLTALPLDKKESKRIEVQELAKGMVIIKHPFKLAWTIELEWSDKETLASWDIEVLKEYINFFPDDGLAKVLRGYLSSELSPITRAAHQDAAGSDPVKETNGDDAEDHLFVAVEDCIVLMMVSLVL